MNNEATITKLGQMRLYGMLRAFKTSMEPGIKKNFTVDEFIAHLVESEWDDRYNRRLQRLIKQASFRYQASLEEVIFSTVRNIDKNQILRFSDCNWIKKGENIIITGATGVGKSFIASALGNCGCINGFSVYYSNVLKLFLELNYAQAEGTYIKRMEKLKKMDVLIIDDFGLKTMDSNNRLMLLELIEDRHSIKSVVIASQVPVNKWHDVIGDSTIADAICDRIIHNSYRIELKGESMRIKKKKDS
jgi:DNA replication protein DnaC